jgi:ATP-dependent RNA helicase DDX24/MAK5
MPDRISSSSKRRRSEAEATATSSTKVAKPTKRSRFDIPSDTLKWKAVKTAPVAGFDEGGGMMMLEELEGVDIEWEEGLNGQKVARFQVCHTAIKCRQKLMGRNVSLSPHLPRC